jgi:minimal CRISPR polymerase domain
VEVIVCFDGDKIGRRVGRAVLANDVGEVRRVDQAINAGNELWRNFAVNVGGSVVELGGDEGRIMIDASRLQEVPGVAQRYAETVGATVSVGVGMKLSEAAQALVITKVRGGNRIIVWDPDMSAEYLKVTEAPKTEAEKIRDEYLTKGEESRSRSTTAAAGGEDLKLVTEHNEKKNAGPNAGFSVQHRPGFTDLKTGKGEKPGSDPSPPPPEKTTAGADFEAQLHDAAKNQSAKDQSDTKKSGDQLEKTKKLTAEALVKVRQQLPAIATLQQASPDAYQAIMGLVGSVVALGKEVMKGSKPAEALDKSESGLSGAGEVQTSTPVNGEMGMSEKSSEESLEKDDKAPAMPRPKVPPGTISDGAIKVNHNDGTTSWKHIQSGMVQAQEPGVPLVGANSHPVSSREPSSK